MSTDPSHPQRAAPVVPVPALSYDELPEGSELRREYDGRGGVTITAPAGELPPSVRRAVGRAGLVPASLALCVCVIVVGLVVFQAARTNRLDPSLRTAAVVALGVLGVGIFLFVWLRHHVVLSYALADARRQSTVLHADAQRLLIETAGPAGGKSLDLAVADLMALELARAPHDPTRPSVPVPCLKLLLRDNSTRLLLAGHHVAELGWVAAALSDVTGVPNTTTRPRIKAGRV